MDIATVDSMLAQTLDDLHLSRAERRALSELLAEPGTDDRDLDTVRSRAFALAKEQLAGQRANQILAWLEEVVRIVAAARPPAPSPWRNEALFSPGPRCVDRITALFGSCRETAEVCVFTITDNRITTSIIDAHRRGVAVRIVSDDDKAHDPGSDLARLAEAGIRIAFDNSSAHMHHKFAILDRRVVISGSYNWTRSAAEANQENLIVSSDPALLSSFGAEFKRLWRRFREHDD
jgi:phosphatidylserine/phosphatidylglycerophosphate/cardiolipin synthase-like enzyme